MHALRTLVLAPWMAPQQIATWQNAIVLTLDGKVDVLEHWQAEVRSAGNRHEGRAPLVIEVPAVVRLRKSDRQKASAKFSRINVYVRDRFTCCFCGQKFPPKELNYDHVLPRVQGGKTVWENIVTSCYPCNSRKGDKTPRQAGMRMHYQPHKPDALPHQPLFIEVNAAPELWRPYLVGHGYAAAAG
jgi:5-methylcytosine-specific restriction endonuclease McrA